eukprot:CAMPEP_0196718358 /NCGR_PEP_ID=MMETSP1091-20130531/1563_1 /TAXON_ID=302021 /ORGANISM="Rhodomonas sp., Strain CCMP768" /LENGTH=319 /DNA_ID=CAMNT_0042058985 /DNA_START=18 /DNA_END=977 /DNA_ORIENTATION=-
MFKPVFVLGAIVASASAFAPAGPGLMRSSARPVAMRGLRMQTVEESELAAAKASLDSKLGDGLQPKGQSQGPEPVSTGGTQYSSLPKEEIAPLFLIPQTSVVGDGAMVGDKGFDPLGFADSIEKLRIYREAELKHGRLAMLAALGWPVAEFLNGPISKAMGAKSLLVASPSKVIAGDALGAETLSRVPSVLNGGLEQVSPIYWASVFAVSAAIEFYATKIQRRAGFRATMAALGAEDLTGIDIDGDGQVGAPKLLAEDNYMPGDLGFDPLNLYAGKSAEWKRDMQLKELNNGRLAMIAITGYAFNEAATKVSVAQTIGL